MNEEWRDVPGYEGLYRVSNLGRVKSLGNGKTHKSERVLKPTKYRSGYLRIGLWKNGKGKRFMVSILVWEAFNGPIPPGMQVNHINEDKTDNRLENLNLMTPKENNNWGTRNERAREKLTNRKDCSKWVIQLSLNNEILHFYPSTKQVERELGYDQGNISRCCLGKYNTAYGYIWKFAE